MAHPAELPIIPDNPFLGLNINDNSILNTLESRYPCEKCSKSRKYFCYSCFCPHPGLKNIIPHVKLPIKIDIIKHRREIDGKSTAAHAAIIASNDIKVYTYPDIPSYDNERVVLIFPSHTAIEIAQLFENNADNINEIKSEFDVQYPKGFNRSTLLKNIPISTDKETDTIPNEVTRNFDRTELPITKAVFIDSTWNQSKGIYKDERIKKLPCVLLQNRISQFWRHQKGSPRWYLATIEAIHQFVVEIHLNAWGKNVNYKGLECCFTEKSLDQYGHLLNCSSKGYNGQYDNLLYFFEHMYKLIHSYYNHDDLYAYKRRMM